MSGGLTAQFVGGLDKGLRAVGQASQNELLAQQVERGQQQAALSPQVNALRTAALTDPNALSQLASLSPDAAGEILKFQQGREQLAQQKFSGLQNREQARVRSVVTGALELSSIPSVAGRIALLERRQKDNARAGLDSRETNEVLALYREGREGEASELINRTVGLGQQLGFVPADAKPTIREGVGPDGQPGFFAVTPTGAQVIPGASPAVKAPLVTIAGEQSEQKALGNLRVKRLDELQTRAQDAREQLASLDVLDALDVRTGKAEPVKLAIASFAESFGVDASALADVPAGQIFTSESAKLLLRVLSTQKGPQTDADRRFIATTLTTLGNAPEANEFIQRSARAQFERTVEEEKFMADYLAQNDTLDGARREWNKFKSNVPFVSQFAKDNERLPVFYFQFREAVADANPGISDAEIQNAWSSQEASLKAERNRGR